MPNGLAARLRRETVALHRQAARAGVMRHLLAGRVDRAAYVRLLRALYPVYVELERSLSQHPAAAPASHADLARAPALAADLGHLHGPGWERELLAVPAGVAYAARILAVAIERPPLLAAHAYVRYLGDLSDGQSLGRLVARGLSLAGEAGMAFYHFPAVADVAQCKRAFRAGLDALPFSADEADLVVDEARVAFTANIRVFEAVTS
jgi:heme oxygenase (biliverdin-producing, ferredoxin)